MSPNMPSLRRSQRGKRSLYQPGDIIEVSRDDTISTGQLLSEIHPDAHTSSTRWLVTFDDDTLADEEVCETSLGKLVQSGAIQQLVATKKGKGKRGRKNKSNDENTAYRHGESHVKAAVECISEEHKDAKRKEDSNHISFKSRKITSSKVSSRVQNEPKKRGRKPKKAKKKEEVVKVKYRTGTLYLYRGDNARAVFIRKF